MKRKLALVMLVACALIWGTSYIAQIMGMQHIGPLTFCASRYAVSFAALSLFLAAASARGGAKAEGYVEEWRAALKRGAMCGAALFTASILQQQGIQYTTAGKAAFITATFIVIVPLFGLFSGKIPSKTALASIVMSMAGLYLLSIKGGFTVGRGDALILAGAFFWAVHIIACSAFARKSDPVKLSAVQFGTVALLSIAGALIFERPSFAEIAASWRPVLYAGLVCTCVAYTFQMSAQRYVHPLMTSIILSTESVFAAFFGWLVLGESLTARELAGCAVLFAATITAQIDDAKSSQ